MKNLLTEIIYGKNSMTGGLIALTVIALIGLGCFCNKDKIDFSSNTSVPNTSSSPTTPSPAPTKAYTKADASKYEIPSENELQDMTKATLLDFNDAIRKADFTDFHRKVAKKWQSQITPEEFKSSFNLFIEKKLDISNIKSETAAFSPAAKIDKSRGLRELIVQGKYNTSPLPAKFKLNYIPEGKEWKLYGIELDTRRD